MAAKTPAVDEETVASLRKQVLAAESLKRAKKNWSLVDNDPDSLTHFRVLLVGTIGYGKSAFVNTVERAVFENDELVAALQDPSEEGTFHVDEYFNNSDPGAPFSLLDTRGQFKDWDEEEVTDIIGMLTGHVRPGELLLRHGERENEEYAIPGASGLDAVHLPKDVQTEMFEKSHAIVFVYQFESAQLETGEDMVKNIARLHKMFKEQGYKPLCLLTFLDYYEGDEDFEEQKAVAVENMVRAVGCEERDIFCIYNYTGKGQAVQLQTEATACAFMLSVMRNAEAFVTEQSRQRQLEWKKLFTAQNRQPQEFVKTLENGQMDLPVHAVLEELKQRCQWPADEVDKLISNLLASNLTSAQLLRNSDYWKQQVEQGVIPKHFVRPLEDFLGIKHRYRHDV